MLLAESISIHPEENCLVVLCGNISTISFKCQKLCLESLPRENIYQLAEACQPKYLTIEDNYSYKVDSEPLDIERLLCACPEIIRFDVDTKAGYRADSNYKIFPENFSNCEL
jgi:hypothetical protein